MATRFVAALAIGLTVLCSATPGAPTEEHPSAAGAPAAAAAQGESAGAARGGKEGLNPLDFRSDLAIYTVVVFLLLLLILWKLAWGPIVRGLDDRERRVREEIAAAERANAEARELLVQHQARIAATEAEIREMQESGRREAERMGREIVEKARAETEAEKQRALREIEGATAGAMKDLAERSATLAVELAGKILQTRLSPSDHAELIREAVDRFVETGNGSGSH